MLDAYDDLVPVEDLMEMLDIGRNKAYELLQSRQIKSFKIGKSYRIPKMCIQNYVLAKVQIQIEEYKQQN
ncbi:helix-turn-helix domain-containing protein [Bacillus sp. S56]|uniref:helix-turn-helix domain-containing protein n=1 Tax=Bacillus sp. S56 TaxID=1226987 RepID=UPI00190AB48F|nr:helix-turn-helix domain-containing protein [Bacillus sp. S56]MBK0075561.1 helix-turn-helix domain-containing protein [Bacillus sp. S56]